MNSTSRPHLGSSVLKADQAAVFVERDRVLSAARAEAEQIILSAKQAYQDECRRGYEEGLAQARQEQAQHIAEAVSRKIDYLSHLEREAVELVMEAVQKIVHGFDERERTLAVVRNAVSIMRNQKHLTLRVHPGQLEHVRSKLRDILSEFPCVAHVDVVPAARLEVDACILESELGIVEASIRGQLQALRDAFESVVGITNHAPA